jgi:predicted Ser/Thr protein kinase
MLKDRPRQIGRYKVEKEIGRGGFGRVYRAHDPTVGRPVAIKILTELNPETQSRFRNEATVAGNLRHNNIVTIYEFGVFEGFPFMAMEFLEGEDLHRMIASGRALTLLEKCTIMLQVADGLCYAHENGVVHRDMKPGNIIALRDGAVKILDFGIARVIRTPDATRLTQQGFLIGTLGYMAPEQLAGVDSDARCDIFAFGAIFYELVTGRHPFQAENAQRVMYRLSFDDPAPIQEFVAGAPDELQRVISKSIHKDREQRYQSLREIRLDLEPIRLELQKGRASELLLQARGLFDEKRLDAAQKVVQDALVLEPANTAARLLWETLQHRIQQRTLQPRIEALLDAGDRHLANRQFAEAEQSFQSALQLDRENAHIRARLDEARSMAEHARKAARLLADARLQFEQQNLTAAFRIVSEALRYDPKYTEAAEFLQSVQACVERRHAEQRVEEAIRKAQGLLLIPAHDEAIAALAAADPESPKIGEWIERVHRDRAAHERKQKLQREVAAATGLLRERQIPAALKRLEVLQNEFPEDQEVGRLLAYAQKEQVALARAKDIASTTAEVSARSQAQEFDRALAVLEQALDRYPGDVELARLLATLMKSKNAWQRRKAIERALAKCESLRAAQLFGEAVDTVKAAIEEHPSEPRLSGFRERLEKEWSRHRRDQAVREIVAKAEEILAQRRPEAAVEMLRDALAAYPADPVLDGIFRRAREQALTVEKARAAERDAAIARRVQDARARAGAGDLDGAFALLDEGLRKWPGATALEELRTSIAAECERRALRERAERELEEIKLSARQLSHASGAIELLSLAKSIASEYAGDPKIQSIAAEPVGILSDIARARQQLAEGGFEAILEICARRLVQHAGHAVFAELQREAEQRRKLAWLEEVQRRAASEVDLRERSRILERALNQSPNETVLQHELEFTRNKLALIDSIVDQARAHEASGRWDLALEKWKSLLTVYAAHPGLQGEIDRAGRAREQALRDDAEREAQPIEQALRIGELAAAAELLRQAQTQHPAAERLKSLGARIEEVGAKRKRARALLAQAETAGDNGRYEACSKLLRQALQLDESDAALRQTVMERFMAYAQDAMRIDWRQAEALLKDAASLGYASPPALLQAIAAKRSEAAPAVPEAKSRPKRKSAPVAKSPAVKEDKRLPVRHIIAVGAAAALLTGGVITLRSHRTGQIPVNIAANVVGAAISAGGKSCVTPDCLLELPAGSYALHAESKGYEPLTREFALKNGQSAFKLELTLKPLPSASASAPMAAAPPPASAPSAEQPHSPAFARLEIAGALPGVQVKVDGQLIGETDRNGALQRDVTPGARTIELSREEYSPVRAAGQFHSGKTFRLQGRQVAMAKLPNSPAAPTAAPQQPAPSAPGAPDPIQVEAQDWAQIANSANPDDFDAFLRNHPGGAHASEARTRSSDLRQQAHARAAQKADQTAWERTGLNNREQLQEYLSRFPSGVHVSEARARLADLEKQSVDAAAAQRSREQADHDQARRANDRQAILGVLSSFEAAYNRKDLEALRRLWNGLPASTFRNQFRDATNLKFQLQLVGEPEIDGNSATAICTRALSYKGQSGGLFSANERVKVTLAREAAGWLIRTIKLE